MTSPNDQRLNVSADPKLEKLSGSELRDLVKLSSRMMIMLDGLWYLSLKDAAGNDTALQANVRAWDRVMQFYVGRLAKLLGVEGRDVADYMKVMDARPDGLVLEESVRILDRNDAIRTVAYCPTIAALEKEGQGRDAIHCTASCGIMREKHSKLFNPAIELTCIRVPPRKNQNDIFCQWQYTIR